MPADFSYGEFLVDLVSALLLVSGAMLSAVAVYLFVKARVDRLEKPFKEDFLHCPACVSGEWHRVVDLDTFADRACYGFQDYDPDRCALVFSREVLRTLQVEKPAKVKA